MSHPLVCSRCHSPLPAALPGGVCPGCGSHVGDTPQTGSTPATGEEHPAPPSPVDTATAPESDELLTVTPGYTSARSPPTPTLPNYDGLTRVGTGGMGIVYRAVQRRTDRVVAVKFLHAAGALDPQQRARFDAEVRALARIRHANIVQVFEVGEDGGCPYFSMEFVPGGTLARKLRTEPLPSTEAARLMAAVAAAVAMAHQFGVLHRDLKPSNILLAEDGTPKVSDFGLAKFADCDDGLTVNGALLGTPPYMAPEQARGEISAIGPHTDVYGLGATLYELLAGQPPFRGKSQVETLHLVQTSEVVPPSRLRAGVPAELEAVCLKCLAKDPADRYATAGEVADELNRWLAGERTRERPPTRFRRALRLARRYRLTLAGVVLLAALLPAARLSVALGPREQIERELAAGRTVTLIGKTGMPRWSEWHTGEVALAESILGDETCGFQTYSTSVLILGRDPMTDTYKLSAELRHLKTNSDVGAVGLFVGLHPIPMDPPMRVTRWVGFEYTEYRRAFELKDPKRAANHGVHAADFLTLRKPLEKEASIGYSRANLGRTFPFIPDGGTSTGWRQIVAHVSPDGLEVYWRQEDQSLALAFSFSADKIARQIELHNLNASQSPVLGGVAYPATPWQPRGAFGVYGRNSAVAFRNVILEPAPRP